MSYQKYRRSIRLKEHDYTAPGYYHVIINTYHRQPFFGKLNDGTVHLNQVGQIAQETWLSLPGRFPCVELDLYVILPDHLHGLVIMKEQHITPSHNPHIDQMPERFRAYWQQEEQHKLPHGVISLFEVLRAFKAATTHRARREGGTPQFQWQRSYFERIGRPDEHDLPYWRQYILNNPIKHEFKQRGWE